MDRVVYMSAYSSAMEATASVDITDPAMESLNKDVNALSKKYNTRMNEIYAEVNAAYLAGNYNEAIARCTDLEEFIKNWKKELSELPPETNFARVLRTTAKIVGIVGGIALAVKSPQLTVQFVKLLTKFGIKASAGVGRAAEFTINLGGQMVASHNLISLVVDAITKKSIPAQYKNEPNGRNVKYATIQSNLDQSLLLVKNTKAQILMTQKSEQAGK